MALRMPDSQRKWRKRVARGKLRATSVNVYEGRWSIFEHWCSKHKIHPWRSSIQPIAEFLLHLFDGGKLKVRSIEGYSTAILLSLKLKGRTSLTSLA